MTAESTGTPSPDTNATPDTPDTLDTTFDGRAQEPQTERPTAALAGTPPPQKASYERSAEVQRWLKQQSGEASDLKPPFDPTFLAHQRDRPWVLSSLTQFYDEDLITDVVRMVKSGKEATVYCCAAHPRTGFDYVAAKVYRPRMFRSLKNDAIYRKSRGVRDDEGNAVFGRRARLHAERKSEKGRQVQVSHWLTYEFETQRLLYKAGADVPKPLAQMGNAVLMEYIGDEQGAAPLLREVSLPSKEHARQIFERILRNIELCLAYERIHGDLSAYNVLYWHDSAMLIDFAQAVEPRYTDDAYFLLARDVERICQHFARYGVEADASALATDLWERYLRADL